MYYTKLDSLFIGYRSPGLPVSLNLTDLESNEQFSVDLEANSGRYVLKAPSALRASRQPEGDSETPTPNLSSIPVSQPVPLPSLPLQSQEL